MRGVLQLQAHLLGDVHEQVVENLQQHRVYRSAGGKLRGARCAPLQHQVVQRAQTGLPAGLDHRGGVFLGNDGRACNHIPRLKVFAHHQRGLVPLGLRVHAHGVAVRHLARRIQHMPLLDGRVASHHGLHRYSFDHQCLALHQKGKALAVSRLKGGLDLRCAAKGHDQRRVAALITHMHSPVYAQLAGAQRLALQISLGTDCQCLQLLRNPGHGRFCQRGLDGLLTNHVLVGETHSISAQHAGQGMHQHARHAQRISHQAGMLAAGAAKTLQGVTGDVIAARHRYFFNGVGHLLHRDVDKAFSHHLGTAAGLRGQQCKFLFNSRLAQRLIGVGAEHLGKVKGLHLADHEVGVGHSQRAAAPVAGGPGVGACALRADAKALAIKLQERAAAGGYGMNAHHRRTHAHPGHLRLKLALELARVVRHIGGGAAHVKADDLVHARNGGCTGHADNAAGGPAQNGVFALKRMCICQPARGLHEIQLHARHLGGHLFNITAQDGRQVGIDHGGVAAADELHHRAGFMRGADLRETGSFSQPSRRFFVRREAVTVHEHNGHAAQALRVVRLKLHFERRLVQSLNHIAVRAQALVGLDHRAVQQLGQHNLTVKQAWAVLVGNSQRVPKAARGHQQRRFALALEQRVGRHRRAHLHAGHLLGAHRLAGL